MSDKKNLSIKEQNKSAASSLLKKNVRKFMRNRLALFGLIVVLIMSTKMTNFAPKAKKIKAPKKAPEKAA